MKFCIIASNHLMRIFCHNNNILVKKIYRKFQLRILKCNFKSWSIVFFGSDDFSLYNLKGLHRQMETNLIGNLEIVVVNKINPVYKYAISNNIKIHFWPPNLRGPFDFGVIASFGKFIPKHVIELFDLGILNVHGSLLPKWRGGMPIVHAVKNGDTTTGITITRITHDKWDAGEIIYQRSCSIGENEVMLSLRNKMSVLGWECLYKVITNIPEYLQNSVAQSIENVSYAPKLNKEIAEINWKNNTAKEVFNLHRALFGTFELQSSWQGDLVKFICLSMSNSGDECFLVDEKGNYPEPGRFTFKKQIGFLIVQCKDKPIRVCTIKYRSKMHTALSFHSGFLHKVSKSLWIFGS